MNHVIEEIEEKKNFFFKASKYLHVVLIVQLTLYLYWVLLSTLIIGGAERQNFPNHKWLTNYPAKFFVPNKPIRG